MSTDKYSLHAMTKTIALVITLLILPCVQPVYAEDTDVAVLRAQLQELQRMVIDLQQQVQELQARIPSRPAAPAQFDRPVTGNPQHIQGYVRPDLVSAGPAGAAAGTADLAPATIRENWHTLEKGMSNQKVSSLLGAPSRSFKLNNKLVWYYDYDGSLTQRPA